MYEDETILAFLDVHPINMGHVLVIPKNHEPNFYDLDDSTYSELMRVVKSISLKVQTELKPKRTGLFIAGWDVPHTHVHVVPMNDYHDITSKRFADLESPKPSEEELAEVAKKINANRI